MADLFFFGTLRHVPLLELVMGRAADDLNMSPATLADHGSFEVVEQVFPTIEHRPGETAEGILVRGLSDRDLDRLNFYEGGFSYTLKPLRVDLPDGTSHAAEVYFPDPGLWTAGSEWDLDAWVADWGPLSMRAAEEAMSYYGRVSADVMATRMPSIRIRAAAWLAQQAQVQDPERDLERDVKVVCHERSHLSFFAMEQMDLQFRRYDGGMSEVMNRSAALIGAATVVLPYDPLRDTVLLIEQFRAATYIAGNQTPWMWEPVAGLIDPGETPEDTAYREAVEEAGVTLTALEPVAQVFSSSGSSGEFVHIFIGLTDLSRLSGGGGLDTEGEDIRSQVISFDALMEGIDRQTYQDMPLVTAALWLARHRDRLREGVGTA